MRSRGVYPRELPTTVPYAVNPQLSSQHHLPAQARFDCSVTCGSLFEGKFSADGNGEFAIPHRLAHAQKRTSIRPRLEHANSDGWELFRVCRRNERRNKHAAAFYFAHKSFRRLP